MSRSAAGHIAGLPLPVWHVALSIVPLLGGAARLLQLAGGDAPAPADLRFSMAPLPVALHIAAATLYALAGASVEWTAATQTNPDSWMSRRISLV